MSKFVFTSESVSEGHPDKVCDAISDAILDNLLSQDPQSRVACETLATTGTVVVSGEVTSQGFVDVERVVKETLVEIGYTDKAYGMDAETVKVLSMLDKQSPEIAQGVDEGAGLHEEQGAGDQGLMFGFACNETNELMPLPIHLSHRLVERMTDLRKDGSIPWLRPDSKSQVSVAYENGNPVAITKVVIATQHNEGLTGRKIIVDTYGGYAPHGGGAFSGKDPSKVDRSAAYMARYIAKNIVAAGLADKCEVQLSYSIGVAEPTSFYVKSLGTSDLSNAELTEVAKTVFPVRPGGIIDHLKLKHPRYRPTAANGHFGRENELFTWEKTDMVDALKSAVAERN